MLSTHRAKLTMQILDLKDFLDKKVEEYNRPGFIEQDPVSIPHLFSSKQDREIMGFFASIFAWGQRKTIINKSKDLIQRMDGAPYQFISQHEDSDLKAMLGFKHRTFNDTDLLYFISFLNRHYSRFDSLEAAFTLQKENSPNWTLERGLNDFRTYFFSLEDFPERTQKHIASPARKSTCKRINMFLRWMVRKDEKGVDFGVWEHIRMSELICPCDVHVERVARKLGLLNRKPLDWKAATELTQNLRVLDPHDPVKYDFALFGLGIEGEM